MNQKLWEQTSNSCLTLQVNADVLESGNQWPRSRAPKATCASLAPPEATWVLPRLPLGCYRIPGVLKGSTVGTTGAGNLEGPFEEELWHQVHPKSSHFAWPFAKPERTEGRSVTLHTRGPDLSAQKTPVPRRHRSRPPSQHGNKHSRAEGRYFAPLTSIYQFGLVLKGDVTLFSSNVPLRQRPE